MISEQSSLRRRYKCEMKKTTEIDDDEISMKTNYTELDSFHRAVSPVLLMSQCLGLMPVVGIRDPNPYHLKYRVKCLAMISSLAFLFLGSFQMMFFMKHLLTQGLTAKNLVGAVFYGCGISVSVLFFFLARHWPDLMRNWFDTEIIFLQLPYEPLKTSVSMKVRVAAILIITFALLEHISFLASHIYSFRKYRILCNISETVTAEDYLRDTLDYMFEVVPFNLPTGLLFLVSNFLFTFMWNYMDLFIVMVSLALSARFQQINNRIASHAGKEIPESLWMEFRHHFVLLCELLEGVDDKLSGIILLSSINNLYFICYQLLNILNKLRYTINYVYFWFSLLYLISRTTIVFLQAASINDEAAKPLKTLRIVPSSGWCSEVERFTEQITTQRVALSGMKFFYLTRKLFFGMAGTIVTYELVLLQFDDSGASLAPLCG